MYPYIYLVLPSYMLMALAGGFTAVVFVYFRIEKYNVEFTAMLKMVLVCIAGILVGGRLLGFLTGVPELISALSVNNLLYNITHGGIVFYGGLLGMLFALRIYIRRCQLSESGIYNLFAPAIALFHGFGRIGCFLGGCCYGKELKRPIILPNEVVIDRIPTQLLESLFEFSLFIFLVIIERKNAEQNLLKIYLLIYASFRFAIEFLRGDAERGSVFGISTSQWISIGIIVYYTVKWVRNKHLKTEAL